MKFHHFSPISFMRPNFIHMMTFLSINPCCQLQQYFYFFYSQNSLSSMQYTKPQSSLQTRHIQQVSQVFKSMTNPPQQDVCFNIWVDKKTLHPRSISRIWLARSAHPDLSHCRVSHPVTSTIFQYSQTPPIQCSQSPHNPPNKIAWTSSSYKRRKF